VTSTVVPPTRAGLCGNKHIRARWKLGKKRARSSDRASGVLLL